MQVAERAWSIQPQWSQFAHRGFAEAVDEQGVGSTLGGFGDDCANRLRRESCSPVLNGIAKLLLQHFSGLVEVAKRSEMSQRNWLWWGLELRLTAFIRPSSNCGAVS